MRFFFLLTLFSVEICPTRPPCFQPGGAEEVEEWGEAAEESPVPQPGRKQQVLFLPV